MNLEEVLPRYIQILANIGFSKHVSIKCKIWLDICSEVDKTPEADQVGARGGPASLPFPQVLPRYTQIFAKIGFSKHVSIKCKIWSDICSEVDKIAEADPVGARGGQASLHSLPVLSRYKIGKYWNWQKYLSNAKYNEIFAEILLQKRWTTILRLTQWELVEAQLQGTTKMLW